MLWRMQRGNRLQSHAIIGPRPNGALIVWFINGHAMGHRSFSDWTSALSWSDRMQAHNWATGWRVASE